MSLAKPVREDPVRRWFRASPEDLRAHFARHGLTYRDIRLRLDRRWSVSTVCQTLTDYREPGYELKWAFAELAAELEEEGRTQ